MAARSFTLSFVGDVMLGRLVDQLLPQHVENWHEHHVASHFVERHPSLLGKGNYTASSPWGTALPLLRDSDLTLINLETAATTTNDPWPHKAFNYRMHPANIAPVLHAVGVDYAGLANNHVLDFGTEGLVETVWALKAARVAFAGAGETTDEARRPAVLQLPRQEPGRHAPSQSPLPYPVHVYSASDHPRDWGPVPTFHLLDYSPATRVRLRTLLLSGGPRAHPVDTDEHFSPSPSEPDGDSEPHHHHPRHSFHHHHTRRTSSTLPAPALKIFSVHWGPNYSWHPSDRIRSLAHFLIDECDVDIVHGHSSHHVQGVERYHGKLIIYGCGDFVDDYALHEDYRNDLGAVWRVVVKERDEGVQSSPSRDGIERGSRGLLLDRLEIFPTRIDRFRATLLDVDDEDHVWVRKKIAALSRELGTGARKELGGQGQVVVDLGEGS
ncbi:hypothetical protein NUU61_006765 [Penicillium alfredii]|uniref:Capsule synthesis protein CapA domain-containing protein n=1 Tax=Penicillium alfredii TaxID=1506179 RepID=A0A9W9F1K7_9EURO|nr:uncharacterized protein NUU61_006765 [Penicillium alfredii]KAJ5091895.1 hypothetical protein NUU61_006765 [Penicillium alfredii]